MNRYLKSAVRMFLCIFCAMLNASVIDISSEEEFNTITASKPIALEFYASWCSVCQHINKPFHQVAQEAEFKDVAFAQIDINKLSPLCEKLGIMGVPTFIYMEGGKKVHQSVGIHDIKGFAKEFRKSLRSCFGPLKPIDAEPIKAPETPAEPLEELPSVDVPTPEESPIAEIEQENAIEEEIEEVEEEIEEIIPEEKMPEILSAQDTISGSVFNEPTYEDEEVYLIDDMGDITFLQWMQAITESFIDMVVNGALWLPRTIIGLCNLLLK